jgi:hypothetical protein
VHTKGGLGQVIAAILFCVSIVAFGQFGLYYWRATIAVTATRQVSNRLRVAAGISAASVGSRDFRAILSVRDLTPDLSGPGGTYLAVRAYYSIAETVGRLIPSAIGWSEPEMAMCSRYVAVVVDQHLDRNMDCATQMRGI